MMQITDNQVDLPLFSAKWLKYFGIVFIVGGIFAIAVPAVAGITVELLLGWLFFLGGCVQIGTALTTYQHKSFWFKFLWAFLFTLVGLWLLLRPAEGVQALAFVVGVLFLVEAIMKMVFAWQWSKELKIGLMLFSGVLSFIIGMILLSSWPQQSAALLGILVGFNLLANGIVALLLSFKMKIIEKT